MPIDFYENDIREVILIFHDTLPKISNNETIVLDRPSIEVKNQINQLDKVYYENVLLSDLNRYHHKILTFLQDPNNAQYAQFYEETSIELKRVVETNREQFDDLKKYLII